MGASEVGVVEEDVLAAGQPLLRPSLLSSWWLHFRVVLTGDAPVKLGGAQTQGVFAFILGTHGITGAWRGGVIGELLTDFVYRGHLADKDGFEDSQTRSYLTDNWIRGHIVNNYLGFKIRRIYRMEDGNDHNKPTKKPRMPLGFPL